MRVCVCVCECGGNSSAIAGAKYYTRTHALNEGGRTVYALDFVFFRRPYKLIVFLLTFLILIHFMLWIAWNKLWAIQQSTLLAQKVFQINFLTNEFSRWDFMLDGMALADRRRWTLWEIRINLNRILYTDINIYMCSTMNLCFVIIAVREKIKSVVRWFLCGNRMDRWGELCFQTRPSNHFYFHFQFNFVIKMFIKLLCTYAMLMLLCYFLHCKFLFLLIFKCA